MILPGSKPIVNGSRLTALSDGPENGPDRSVRHPSVRRAMSAALIFICRPRSIWRLSARVRWLNTRFIQDVLSALDILPRFKSRIRDWSVPATQIYLIICVMVIYKDRTGSLRITLASGDACASHEDDASQPGRRS